MSPNKANTELFYQAPAKGVTEALPLGNGTLGALVDSDPAKETAWLTEESFWSAGQDATAYNRNASKKIRTAWQNYQESPTASEMADFRKKLQQTAPQARLPLGKLEIRQEIPHGSSLAFYERSLDLSTAVLQSSFAQTGGDGPLAEKYPLREFKRESFLSYPDQVYVSRWESLDGAPMQLKAKFKTEYFGRIREQTYGAESATILYSGQSPDETPRRAVQLKPASEGQEFIVGLSVQAQGENVTFRGNSSGLNINGATTVVFLLSVRTTLRSKDPATEVGLILSRASQTAYEELRQRHREDFSSLFDTFALDLQSDFDALQDTDSRRSVDSALRLKRYYFAPILKDASVYALAVQYARYLSLSGQRNQALPALPQGLWYDAAAIERNAAYPLRSMPMDRSCDADSEPLLALLEKIAVEGKKVAQTVYNLDGIVCHEWTDPYGYSWPDASADQIWPFGAVALCERYASCLENFEGEAWNNRVIRFFPILQESLRFCLKLAPLPEKEYWCQKTVAIYRNLIKRAVSLPDFAAILDEALFESLEGEIYTDTVQPNKTSAAKAVDPDKAIRKIRSAMYPISTDTAVRTSGLLQNFLRYEGGICLAENRKLAEEILQLLIQGTDREIFLLPALPLDFHSGYLTGLVLPGGLRADLRFKAHELVGLHVSNPSEEKVRRTLRYRRKERILELQAGEEADIHRTDFR